MNSSSEYNGVDTDTHLTKTEVLEMAYQDVLRDADTIIKDEAARRLRLRIILLENENDELHEQLAVGDERVDVAEQEIEELCSKLRQAEDDLSQKGAEMRAQAREMGNLKAELTATTGVTSESARVLTEKLALARELATLRPEVEHLRSQASHQKTVLAEKLDLERQLNTLEVELETEKRAASKRAAQKNQNHEREIELQAQVETLQKDLAKEKRTKNKASKETEAELQIQIDSLQKDLAKMRLQKEKLHDTEAELQGQIEGLQKDLAKEKREKDKARKNIESELQSQIEKLQESLAKEKKEREKARKEAKAEFQSQLEELEKELAREKRESQKAGQDSEIRTQIDALQRDLAREKRERIKDRKEAETERQNALEELQTQLAREKRETEKAKTQAEKGGKASDTKEALLESKLEQFRTKLRSTKERLKECETELAQARAAATKGSSKAQGNDGAKNPRKRTATEMASDFTIGTPDGAAMRRKPANKRSRLDPSMVGEKSMFSITPFLNRTMSMAPDVRPDGLEELVESDAEAEEASRPLAFSKPIVEEEADVEEEIAPAPKVASKPAPKPRGRKKAADKEPKVLGEAGPRAQNMKLPALTIVEEEEEDDEAGPAATKPPKVSENAPIIQKSKAQEPKMKKRKVLGQTKTLFDEDDEGSQKRPAKITLGAPTLLAKARGMKPKVSLQPKNGMGAFGDFSPLKKDRRGVGASFLA